VIVTERLILRRFRATDLPAFVAYRSHPDVARYQGWDASFAMADAVRFLAEQDAVALGTPGVWTQLAAVDRLAGTLHGDCAACISADDPGSAEIGVTFAPGSQGHGYATEALTALLTTLFDEHGVERVHAECHRRNGAVHALMQRLGLRRTPEAATDPDWCLYAMRRAGF
jgi:RimJ/RimL family protein N-acetyltransferase